MKRIVGISKTQKRNLCRHGQDCPETCWKPGRPPSLPRLRTLSLCHFKCIKTKMLTKKLYLKVFKNLLQTSGGSLLYLFIPFKSVWWKLAFFLYLLNQTSCIAAQKKKIEALKMYFWYPKSYVLNFIFVSTVLMPF